MKNKEWVMKMTEEIPKERGWYFAANKKYIIKQKGKEVEFDLRNDSPTSLTILFHEVLRDRFDIWYHIGWDVEQDPNNYVFGEKVKLPDKLEHFPEPNNDKYEKFILEVFSDKEEK